MSRVEYADDEEYPGQHDLWRANLRRMVTGKRGQQIRQETERALLALPAPRLVPDALEANGEVCLVGALALARAGTMDALLAQVRACRHCGHFFHLNPRCGRRCTNWSEGGALWSCWCPGYAPGPHPHEDLDTLEYATDTLKLPYLMAFAMVELNDEVWARCTPEERYTKALEWCRKGEA